LKNKQQIKSFEDLECWKAGVEVRKYISGLLKKFPESEKFDLIHNMKRASHSVTRNIAEGYGRFHFKENMQFCRHSRGSLYELIDDLITSRDENFVSVEEYLEGRQKIDRALCILNGFINYLNKALNYKSENTEPIND
jgi:four helix bundle protein